MLKNVLMQYFSTNDATIHVNLLRVVFTAMRFSDDEQTRVKEAFNTNNMGYMARMAGNKLI